MLSSFRQSRGFKNEPRVIRAWVHKGSNLFFALQLSVWVNFTVFYLLRRLFVFRDQNYNAFLVFSVQALYEGTCSLCCCIFTAVLWGMSKRANVQQRMLNAMKLLMLLSLSVCPLQLYFAFFGIKSIHNGQITEAWHRQKTYIFGLMFAILRCVISALAFHVTRSRHVVFPTLLMPISFRDIRSWTVLCGAVKTAVAQSNLTNHDNRVHFSLLALTLGVVGVVVSTFMVLTVSTHDTTFWSLVTFRIGVIGVTLTCLLPADSSRQQEVRGFLCFTYSYVSPL